MLNNADIISLLTDEQKIALVADISAASGEAYGAAGVPHLEKTELSALNGVGEYACHDFAGLASSWNTKLIEFVTGCVLTRADISKYNFVGAPKSGLKTGPCSGGLTEDPFLNAKLEDAFVSAINASGAAAYTTGHAIGGADTEYLDANVDDAVLFNLVTRALWDSVVRGKQFASEMTMRPPKGEWKAVNARIVERLRAAGKRAVLLRDMPEETFLSGLTDPKLMFVGASVSSLRSALKNHARMKEDVEHGSIGADELEKAVAAGTAVSPEILHIAVDKIIDFIKSVAVRSRTATPRTDEECRNAALYAARESIVMLKNNGVLPFNKPGANVAVVGELAGLYGGFNNAVADMCKARGMIYIGNENGYKLDEERSDTLLPSAVELCRNADVVIAFVGLGKPNDVKFTRHESLNLPANQYAVLDEIHKIGKKIIAVVVGGVLPNMKFDGVADGIINIPFGGGQTVKALCEIITGAVCPSGKLVYTAHLDADEYYTTRKQAVTAGRYKMGGFIGYRRCVSENDNIKYPFGFGLSYSKFTYSGLKVTKDSIEVTVKNAGSMPAAEIVQLYIGKKSSAAVRPARELKGFAKVFIEPGKSTQIRLPIWSELFEIYDKTDGRRKVEAGEYELYVGASSADIRLTGSITMSGVKLNKSADKPSDYLPTLTNIIDGGYRMTNVSDSELPFRAARPAGGDVSYEKLFADEFAELDDEDDGFAAASDDEDDVFDFLDDSVTVATTVEGLIKYSESVGMVIDRSTAFELVSALAASRVVMLRCDKPEFDMLISVVCGYFGCPISLDDTSGYSSPDDLFNEGGSSLVSGLSYASAHREGMTFIALDNVQPGKLGQLFTPFIRYATAPDKIKVTFGTAKRALDVSKNIWFLMRLYDGRCEFPAYVADMASLIIPKVTVAEAVDVGKAYAPNFYQFAAACRRSESRYELEEAQWKKLDALEKFAAARAPFKMGNKLCVQIEKISAVLLECGLNQFETLDGVVAQKLVPHLATALEGKIAIEDGGLVGSLDSIFGEDDSTRIKLAARRAVGKEGGV